MLITAHSEAQQHKTNPTACENMPHETQAAHRAMITHAHARHQDLYACISHEPDSASKLESPKDASRTLYNRPATSDVDFEEC